MHCETPVRCARHSSRSAAPAHVIGAEHDRSHPTDLASEGFNLFPVGIVNNGLWIGRSFGHPHDEADDLPVPETIDRVVEFTGKYGQLSWLPRNLSKEFLKIRVGFRLVFIRFSCDQTDREKGIGLTLENMCSSFDELVDLLVVFAVSNTRSEDNLVERAHVHTRLNIDWMK